MIVMVADPGDSKPHRVVAPERAPPARAGGAPCQAADFLKALGSLTADESAAPVRSRPDVRHEPHARHIR